MLNFLQYSSSNSSFKDKETVSCIFADLQSLTDDTETTVFITKIKSLLQSPDTKNKSEALLWLVQLVNTCSNDVFKVQSFPLFTLVVETLKKSDCSYNATLAYCIIQSIIKRGLKSPTEDYGAITQVIQAILKTCSEDEFLHSLNCLSMVIEKWPALCKPYKENIEKYLCSRFDSSNADEIEAVASCFSYLPSIGGKQDGKFWSDQFDKMVNTIGHLAKCHFDVDLPEFEGRETFDLPPPCEQIVGAALECYRQFHAISVCVAKMLSSNIPSSVFIPGPKIMSLICSLLRFTYIPEERLNSEAKGLASVWLALIKDVLMVLEGLILNCHDSMLDYKSVLCEVLMYQLEESVPTDVNLRYRSYIRSHIYRVILALIAKVEGNGLKKRETKLFKYLLHDIEIIQDDSKEFFPLRKRDNSEKNVFQNESSFPPNYAIRRDNCLEALKVLSFAFTKKEKTSQVLPQRVVDILGEVTSQLPYPAPYDDEQCRKELYSLFIALAIQTRAMGTIPISIALKHFGLGVQDTSIEVSRLCMWASSMCSSMIHSVRPPQPLPVEIPQKPLASVSSLPSTMKITAIRTLTITETIPVGLQNCNASPPGDFIGKLPAIQNDIDHQFDEQADISQDHNVNHVADEEEDEEMEEEEEPENIESDEDEEVVGEEEDEEEDIVQSAFGENLANMVSDVLEPSSPPNLSNFHSPLKAEKQSVNNGLYLLQNGVVSSGEEEQPQVDERKKRNVAKRSRDFHVESTPKKKLKEIDQEDLSADGDLSNGGGLSLSSMMRDFNNSSPDVNLS